MLSKRRTTIREWCFPMMLLQLTFDMQQDHNILKKLSFLSILLLSKFFLCLRIERLSSIYVL